MTGGRGGGVWRGDPANDVYMAPTLLYLYHLHPRHLSAHLSTPDQGGSGLNTALGRVTLVLVTDTCMETMGGSDEDLKHWIL